MFWQIGAFGAADHDTLDLLIDGELTVHGSDDVGVEVQHLVSSLYRDTTGRLWGLHAGIDRDCVAGVFGQRSAGYGLLGDPFQQVPRGVSAAHILVQTVDPCAAIFGHIQGRVACRHEKPEALVEVSTEGTSLQVCHDPANELRERLVDLVFETGLACHFGGRHVVHFHLEEGRIGREQGHQQFG